MLLLIPEGVRKLKESGALEDWKAGWKQGFLEGWKQGYEKGREEVRMQVREILAKLDDGVPAEEVIEELRAMLSGPDSGK